MDHTDIVRDLTFAPDGSLMLVSASRDKTLRVWDLKDDGMEISFYVKLQLNILWIVVFLLVCFLTLIWGIFELMTKMNMNWT